jgi:diguanylate cyclase (GGDEF)-like protein
MPTTNVNQQPETEHNVDAVGKTASSAGASVHPRTAKPRWHPAVRLVLVLGVLFPTVATAILITSDASSQWSSRQNAQVVASKATELQTMALARSELIHAVTPLLAVSYAQRVGLSINTLNAILNIDFPSSIRQSVATITDNSTFRSTPTLRADNAVLAADASKVLAGTIGYTQLKDQTDKFMADLVNLWNADYNNLQNAVARWQPPGTFEVHVAALRQTYEAFVEGGFAIEGGISVMTGEAEAAAKQELIAGVGAYAIATQQFAGHLGPKGQAAWSSLQTNEADRNFQGTLQEAVGVALNAQPAPWASDPALAGPGMTNGLKFLTDINVLVRAASADLRDTATAQASAATRNFIQEILFLFLLAGISIGGVVIASRSLSRPLQKLAGAARKISDGDFDLAPLPARGPREVVATNVAFNDMASTLKAVEAKAVALAGEDLSHPELQIPLPGRTGQALQATVDTLTTRIREQKLQRQDLHKAATHDQLTGLLNRAAIFDYLTHDVTQRRQAGETVAVLFIDLDGLKPMNDTYGHEAGDRAIVATAKALMEAIGTRGVVARLGGDEFLAVLSGEERRNVQSVADRISQAVAARSVSSSGVVIPLRCSIGVAFAECDADIDPMELVRQADKAMYDAKKASHASQGLLAVTTFH